MKTFLALTDEQRLTYLFKSPSQIRHDGFQGAVALLWDPRHGINGGHPQTAYEMASFFNEAHKALFGSAPADCEYCMKGKNSDTPFFVERGLK